MIKVLKVIKSLPDRFLAVLFLIVFLPLLIGVYAFLRAASSPPHIVADDTLIDGRVVHTYRFRTTGHGSSAFHSFGRMFRRWKIDEWPSIWNVLRGDIRLSDMSIWRP